MTDVMPEIPAVDETGEFDEIVASNDAHNAAQKLDETIGEPCCRVTLTDGRSWSWFYDRGDQWTVRAQKVVLAAAGIEDGPLSIARKFITSRDRDLDVLDCVIRLANAGSTEPVPVPKLHYTQIDWGNTRHFQVASPES
jgi:hypothetical protein